MRAKNLIFGKIHLPKELSFHTKIPGAGKRKEARSMGGTQKTHVVPEKVSSRLVTDIAGKNFARTGRKERKRREAEKGGREGEVCIGWGMFLDGLRIEFYSTSKEKKRI